MKTQIKNLKDALRGQPVTLKSNLSTKKQSEPSSKILKQGSEASMHQATTQKSEDEYPEQSTLDQAQNSSQDDNVQDENNSSLPNMPATKIKSLKPPVFKTTKKKVTASSKSLTTTYTDELKVLFQMNDKILFGLRYSSCNNSQPVQKEATISKVSELLFPVADSVLAYCTEIVHLINRPIISRNLVGSLELFFQLLKTLWTSQIRGENPIVKSKPGTSECDANVFMNKGNCYTLARLTSFFFSENQ